MRNEKIAEMQPFSVRLKELRKEKGVKQAEIAEVLGCTPNHYQKIEYGQINVPSTNLMILADYFGVTTDYLLGRSEDGGPADDSLSVSVQPNVTDRKRPQAN